MFKKENKKVINNMKIVEVSSIILSNLMKILLLLLFAAIYIEELKPFFESGFLLFFMVYFPYIFVSFIQTKYIGKL
jgi:hypothetical protein